MLFWFNHIDNQYYTGGRARSKAKVGIYAENVLRYLCYAKKAGKKCVTIHEIYSNAWGIKPPSLTAEIINSVLVEISHLNTFADRKFLDKSIVRIRGADKYKIISDIHEESCILHSISMMD